MPSQCAGCFSFSISVQAIRLLQRENAVDQRWSSYMHTFELLLYACRTLIWPYIHPLLESCHRCKAGSVGDQGRAKNLEHQGISDLCSTHCAYKVEGPWRILRKGRKEKNFCVLHQNQTAYCPFAIRLSNAISHMPFLQCRLYSKWARGGSLVMKLDLVLATVL